MNISVVIPLFNKKDTIINTLQSVFNQELLPAEIVVVNDGSTDGSALLVEQLHHPLITLLHQENAGVSAARNNGIFAAKHEWIAFLDADDLWMTNYLKEMNRLSLSFSNCSILASAYYLQNFNGNKSPIVLNKMLFNQDGILTNYFQVASNSNPPLCSSSLIIRKKSLLEINGFPFGIKSGEDLLTWARLAVTNEIAYTTKYLAIFVQDPAHTYDAIPNRVPEPYDTVTFELLNLAKQYPENKQIIQYVSFWKKMRASSYLRLGHKKHALQEALYGIRYNFLNTALYAYVAMLVLPTAWINYIFKLRSKSK